MKSRLLIFREINIGSIQPFAGDVVPDNYMKCDGTIISRNEYPELFEIIGTAWGHGDGSTTFHLPDLRGRMMRGVDEGAGNDPEARDRIPTNSGGNTGDKVGSLQGSEYKSHGHGTGNHRHTYITRDQQSQRPLGSGTFVNGNSTGWRNISNGRGYDFVTYPNTGAYSLSTIGKSESRSKNVSVRYIIRVK